MMEFIHTSSAPATISELDLFKVPPTQTVIENIYDVEYRPVGSLTKSSVYEFSVPASEHYTDLAATYLYAKMKITSDPATEKVMLVNNYAASLFEQLDVYLGNVNITPGNSLYHYQVCLEDLFFRYDSPVDDCQLINPDDKKRSDRAAGGKVFDLIIPIRAPMFQQEKFLIDGVPITLRLKCAPASFGVVAKDNVKVSTEFSQLSLFIRRVKLFPQVQMAITGSLAKQPASYYFQRNEMKSFLLTSGFAATSIDNVYNGQLPQKVILGLVSDKAFAGAVSKNPFNFENVKVNDLSLVVNGMKIPSSSYKPDFTNDLFMREYFNIFRSLNREYSVPNININYQDFKSKYPLYVFDLTDDGTLTNESGALSLVKRGNVRIDLQLQEALKEGVHIIVFGIYDSLLQIDASRNIVVDY